MLSFNRSYWEDVFGFFSNDCKHVMLYETVCVFQIESYIVIIITNNEVLIFLDQVSSVTDEISSAIEYFPFTFQHCSNLSSDDKDDGIHDTSLKV